MRQSAVDDGRRHGDKGGPSALARLKEVFGWSPDLLASPAASVEERASTRRLPLYEPLTVQEAALHHHCSTTPAQRQRRMHSTSRTTAAKLLLLVLSLLASPIAPCFQTPSALPLRVANIVSAARCGRIADAPKRSMKRRQNAIPTAPPYHRPPNLSDACLRKHPSSPAIQNQLRGFTPCSAPADCAALLPQSSRFAG